MPKLEVKWSDATETSDNVLYPNIIGYEVSYKEDISTTWIVQPFITSSATFDQYDWVGGSFGKIYDFRIRTKYIDNTYTGYRYTTVSTTPDVIPTPGPVLSSSKIEDSSDTLYIEFSGQSDLYGIKGYEVAIKPFGGPTWTITYVASTAVPFYRLFTGLTIATQYSISIRVLNEFDVYSSYYFVDYYTLVPIPKPFKSHSITDESFYVNGSSEEKSSVNIRFEGARDETGITGYEVSINDGTGWDILPFITGTAVDYNHSFTELTPTVVSLPPNPYDFRIRAKNSYGSFSSYYTISAYLGNSGTFTYKRSSSGVPSTPIPNACITTSTPSVLIYSDKFLKDLTAFDILYEDAAKTIAFDGLDKFYKVGSPSVGYRTFNISLGGEIYEQQNCYYYKILRVSSGLSNVGYLEGSSCGELSVPDTAMYSSKPINSIIVNDILYSTNYLTTVFNGSNLWYKSGELISGYRAFRISSLGVVLQIENCEDYV